MLQYSFSIFPIPLSWRVSYIIYLLLDHLDPTLVDHLNLHLSAYPIRHPLWFSVSCGSQGNIVQGSSQRKCGQESSCSAFNAVVAAFLKIFLRSHHLRRSWHTSLSLELPRRSSWSLEHVFETYLSMSDEIFLLKPSSHLYFAHWVLGLNHSLPFTRPQIA